MDGATVMALDTAVFDNNVFSVGVFDSLSVTPLIDRISVPRAAGTVEPGQGVPIFVYIVDAETTPGRSFYWNPGGAVQIQVYSHLDTNLTAFVDMINVGVGIYAYQYSVPFNANYGAYAVRITAENG